MTRGARCYIFGKDLERVVWPYFVKYFLLRASVALDPYSVFDGPGEDTTEVANLCVVDNGPRQHPSITALSPDAAYDCAEQLALALNVYRLEEDLLDLLGGDYAWLRPGIRGH